MALLVLTMFLRGRFLSYRILWSEVIREKKRDILPGFALFALKMDISAQLHFMKTFKSCPETELSSSSQLLFIPLTILWPLIGLSAHLCLILYSIIPACAFKL